ncbi:invasion associated locus B family protein [Ovoidimarina sediminis]|uniref:invasion associated locus B family protein n=1 Tax=Ovoidimarina sediminis TaxID=3079856 RepID=UPI00292F125B|nr:invasion associated locus B family protein [Rhodophyticola sp. MJ-SS7]
MMQSFSKSLGLAILVAIGVPAIAQDQSGTNSESSGLSTGTAVEESSDGVGTPYVKETSGDWEVRCVRTEDGNDPCQLYQLLKDQNGTSVAEITVFPLPQGGQAVAGATIITPLETLLTEQITMQIDSGGAKRYPFSFCTRSGCISRIGLLEEDLAAFRAGNAAQLRIVPVTAPDQNVLLTVSLSGFTAGYNAIGSEN